MSAHNYDRRGKKAEQIAFPYSSPAKADESLNDCYLSLHTFKAGFDRMEEIPTSFHPIYDQTMKTLDVVMKAKAEVHQLRMMARKLPTR